MNDIEVLEERVITLKRHIKNYEESDCLTDVYQQLVKECRAIENLLKERQSDKERIKELEEINEAHKKENGELRERVKELKETQKILEHNYQVAIDETINKYVIKENIEEIDKWLDKGKYADYGMNPYELKAQKQVLEELLKGE